MNNKKEKLICVLGPTASGKTKLSVDLAKEINAEIISADSMQIYKEMNIASAKPTKEEMDGIKHYLIDEVSLNNNFSVYDYVKLANSAFDEIINCGKKVILCGGTGLYIDSFINNISFSETEVDFELREKLNKRAQVYGGDALLKELSSIDKEYAEKLHPNNIKKIVRALELYYTTQKTMTEQLKDSRVNPSRFDTLFIGLNYKCRDTLYDKINYRVDVMVENGLIEESKSIFDSGYNATGCAAIGYKELIPYFEGKTSKEEAIEKIKRETRRYAKRQLTWFRRNKDINWIFIDEFDSFDEVRDKALHLIEDFYI